MASSNAKRRKGHNTTEIALWGCWRTLCQGRYDKKNMTQRVMVADETKGRDQGGHFLGQVVESLTTFYAVVHKQSTPYYPQANGLVESTNKTLQNILRKIINENRTDWDTKLRNALWAYWAAYKMSIRSTPFWLAFGLEAVMPIEFQVPSLQIHVRE
mgnify:CR=1 FL=1